MLKYLRVATKQRDLFLGFLYIHAWKTGFQELVFKTHDDAKMFASNENIEFSGPRET